MTQAGQPNRHCSVVVIDGCGVLIEGRSGTGKTSLALGLVDTATARGLRAALVSDDQAILQVRQGELVASAPTAISGLAEIRGYGIAEIRSETKCAIALVGRLVADEAVERMPEPKTTLIEGIELPLLELPQRHEQQSARIVLAWLEANRSDPSRSGHD